MEPWLHQPCLLGSPSLLRPPVELSVPGAVSMPATAVVWASVRSPGASSVERRAADDELLTQHARRVQEARSATLRKRERAIVHSFGCNGSLSLFAVGPSTVVVARAHCSHCVGHRRLAQQAGSGEAPDYFPLDPAAREATMTAICRATMRETGSELRMRAKRLTDDARNAMAAGQQPEAAHAIAVPRPAITARGTRRSFRSSVREAAQAAAPAPTALAPPSGPTYAAALAAPSTASSGSSLPRYLGFTRTLG